MLKMVGAEADRLGLECYVIGGYVRDLFLHRESTDIDVVVVGSGISLAEAVAKKLGKGAHLSVFKTYGTAQVKRGDLELEFVGARKESYTRDSRNPIVEDGTLQEDQDRRDFTINAMAICLNSSRYGELLDPFDGIGDLERCIIRTPLNPDITFSDDPLRMMRAIRFATQLGFNLHPDTFDAIRRNASRLEIITRERIAEELNKIMMSRRPSDGWLLLDKTGLLPLVLPDLVALKGVEVKDGKGHKDVFLHTLKVLDNLADSSDKLWLRWAALLHDIGKPRSKAWDPQAGWTFRNHNYIGAKMVPRIFAKLKLPLNEEEKKARFHRNYQLVRQKMVELEERDRIRNFQPPVKGDEIMEILHLEPCSIVGELKAAIKDAILDGIIPNEYEPAKEYMLKLAHEKGLC